jgi:hypothetical protein
MFDIVLIKRHIFVFYLYYLIVYYLNSKTMKSLFLSLFLLSLNAANATIFTVSNTNDAGPGSLRNAIIAANADASATGIYAHIIDAMSLTGTITLETSLPVLNNYIAIGGPNAGGLIISGNNAVAIFLIAHGKKVDFSNLVIKNGSSASGGAGIYNAGSALNIDYCTFEGNATTGTAQGGAIWNGGGGANINGCTFKNNTSSNTGGAIANYGQANFINCTFVGNRANGGSAIMDYNTTKLTNCTVTGNTGDGINIGSSWTTIYNSIIVGNGSDIVGNNNTATINYCLIGSITTTTISGNVSNATGVTASAVFGSNILKNNGGITETIAILNPGPAVDAGSSILSTTYDQTGKRRDEMRDIGAYESTGPTAVEDERFSNGIKVYANPSDGIFTFEVNETVTGNMDWMVLGAEGKNILRKSVSKGNGSETYSINLEDYPSGIYYLTVSSGDFSAMKVLIKK